MTMAKLFYVIGPSGAGKDSLLNHLRQHYSPDDGIAVAHRYITRDANAGGENYISLSEEEFLHRKEAGLFFMDWQSHGYYYGIGLEVSIWLGRGINVVVNGSRGYLPEARVRFNNVRPILVHVETDILRERLLARGREPNTQIEKRLARASQSDSDLLSSNTVLKVDNNGPIELAGKALFDLIMSEVGCSRQVAI
ncbi:phosphonate metabolism protein/1,5-bisphosphokinase (PRPP-forming) PhnN [Catenovulum sp. SM1970]|uniref:phosphonate metabolism protein/1,5-bisphosphokinase (PRPP-forming) PhnN n=1 Tax=Marinifaba aquimaris TaxID=2741323 RepID=UPI001574D083|nr:phosphonate metabolism protein/1,5-bisphosphokinase (PRPP-forming) PhnN [Marinifaba aquimaris]NTS78867.1 phosphonate metabolism protein/1,5-bisphosphokinase (PRPP-forming) PhnN [Marinifaba aquimaris]